MITVKHIRLVSGSLSDIRYIGRPSPLGNPFVIGEDGDRIQVIAKYEKWLRKKIKEKNKKVMDRLTALFMFVDDDEDLELWCWCAPLPCHGDVIKKILLEWRKKK